MVKNLKIIDNFLDKEIFKIIQKNIIESEGHFEWFYQNFVVNKKDSKDCFQFTHIFYSNNIPRKNYTILKPLIEKINPFSIIKIKANLLTRTEKIKQYNFHTDIRDKKNITTSIFYLNTCNGFTLFKDGKKIESKENRFISFDSNLEHTGTSCTDENIRAVINLNYYEN